MLGNTALDAALNAQFLVQIGVFTAVPMIMGFILEQGLMKVCLAISVIDCIIFSCNMLFDEFCRFTDLVGMSITIITFLLEHVIFSSHNLL